MFVFKYAIQSEGRVRVRWYTKKIDILIIILLLIHFVTNYTKQKEDLRTLLRMKGRLRFFYIDWCVFNQIWKDTSIPNF